MGACLSRSDDEPLVGLQSSYKYSNRHLSKSNSKTNTLTITTSPFHHGDDGGTILSPSEKTEATNPVTPSSTLSSPQRLRDDLLSSTTTQSAHSTSSSNRINLKAVQEKDDDEENNKTGNDQQNHDAGSFAASISLGSHLARAAVVDSVITEEESLGATSDEEEAHVKEFAPNSDEAMIAVEERPFQEEGKTVKSISSKQGSVSSRLKKENKRGFFPRPGGLESSSLSTKSQSQVKLLSRRIATPDSIIHHPSLVAPPVGIEINALCAGDGKQSSVNPQTIANFNRLKIQVQLANRADKQRKHKEKVQDRFEEVEGYKDLWNDYENLKKKVQEKAEGTQKAGDDKTISEQEKGLDIRNSDSWYFDFRALKSGGLDDDDDNCSQVSLSLLSDTNMEVQRRLYKDKRKKRNDRRHQKTMRRDRRDVPDDRSIGSINSTASKRSIVFIRGQLEDNGYGPVRQVCIPGVVNVDSDADTPKRKSKRGDDDYSRTGSLYDDSSVISDLDMENDYNVPRRRWRHRLNNTSIYQDDQSVSTIGERSLEGLKLSRAEMEMITDNLVSARESVAPNSIEVKKKMPESPKHTKKSYGFDPSAPLSSQIDLAVPSVQIDNVKSGEVHWRQADDDGKGSGDNSRNHMFRGAARRLEDFYGADEDPVKRGKEQLNHTSKIRIVKDCSGGEDDIQEVSPKPRTSVQSPGVTIKNHKNEDLNDRTPKPDVNKPSLINPYEVLSSDHFLLLSSSPHFEHESSFDAEEDRTDSREDEREQHDEREAIETGKSDIADEALTSTRRCTSDPGRSNTLKTYDPAIEYMSSDAFMLFSGKPSTDSFDSGLSENDKVASRQQDQDSLTDFSQPDVNAGNDAETGSTSIEKSQSHQSLKTQSDRKHDTCQNKSCDCTIESSCKSVVSINHCDELADELAAKINKVLSDFREVSKIL